MTSDEIFAIVSDSICEETRLSDISNINEMTTERIVSVIDAFPMPVLLIGPDRRASCRERV